MAIMSQLSSALIDGDQDQSRLLTKKALALQHTPQQILDEGLMSGMKVVGEKFAVREIFLPNLLLAARAMYAGLDILKPLLSSEDLPTAGKVVIGTVLGDVHDLGKNLVGIMLKGAGFEVIDLGKDVSAEDFLAAAEKNNATVIGMSALLTTTMPVMKDVVELLHERDLNGSIKTIVGGAPVNKMWADDIGADAYAYDALQAVEAIKELIGITS